MSARSSQPEEATPRRRGSLWPKRKKRRRDTAPIDAEADQQLDEALSRLAEATHDNDAACKKVRERQSNGGFKIVSSVPPKATE